MPSGAGSNLIILTCPRLWLDVWDRPFSRRLLWRNHQHKFLVIFYVYYVLSFLGSKGQEQPQMREYGSSNWVCLYAWTPRDSFWFFSFNPVMFPVCDLILRWYHVNIVMHALNIDNNNNKMESKMALIIMYIYHALINALSADMIDINLNMIFYTHVEHSPTKTIYISIIKKYIKKRALQTHTHTDTHWL